MLGVPQHYLPYLTPTRRQLSPLPYPTTEDTAPRSHWHETEQDLNPDLGSSHRTLEGREANDTRSILPHSGHGVRILKH